MFINESCQVHFEKTLTQEKAKALNPKSSFCDANKLKKPHANQSC